MKRHSPAFLVLVALSPLLFAAPARATPSEYVCAARIDCGAPRLPSTQDLPTLSTPIVRSGSIEKAKEKCMARYSSSYLRLARTIASSPATTSVLLPVKSCEVLSEALPVSPATKN